jgi:hypothetical protein
MVPIRDRYSSRPPSVASKSKDECRLDELLDGRWSACDEIKDSMFAKKKTFTRADVAVKAAAPSVEALSSGTSGAA